MALGLALSTQLMAADVLMKPTAAQAEAALWTSRVLERYRYKPEGQSAPAGVPVLDAYLDALDPDRLVFTQADVEAYDSLRAGLGMARKAPDVAIAFTIHDRYRARLADRMVAAVALLDQPMDFSGKERYQRLRTGAARPRDGQELDRLWRLRVMDDYLSLRLAGLAEEDVRLRLRQRYHAQLRHAERMQPMAVFERFMSAYTRYLDPDSAYLAEEGGYHGATHRLSGIGVDIGSKAGLIRVHAMAPDGAAARSGRLKPGDRILGLARNAAEPMVDVVGWPADEVAALADEVVGVEMILDVLPAGASPDAPRTRIGLVRDREPGPTRLAESRIEVVKRGAASYRIGVVKVPEFYQDTAAKRRGLTDFSSMSRDLAVQLGALRRDRVDALMLDFRGNGGGALDETLRLVGLFAPGAPVTQQRSGKGEISVEKAPEGAAAWDGPLAVLVDRGSAAGAEIVTAALQDLGRAIVLGDRTYGRSTVQTLVDLSRLSKDIPGELKMTVSQVFRLDGSSFEGQGVKPDILLPGLADAGPAQAPGKAFDSPPLMPLAYRKDGTLAALLPALRAQHQQRCAKDARCQALLASRALDERGQREVSLNEAERRSMRDAQPVIDARAVQQAEALQVLADALALPRQGKP
ncbi:carboxy terminal-processing peptidase [Massilia sp. IC2-477]|uniref:carboxy terminal-processing peptidase n=1 Tax=Massilia sp. IC2-477 TaxID=2887198 RepID=UPI001D10578B|nr:carboxy terminal-processing peptidase [Massilia sp. IC2-477]MCC2957357.1 carboxy terminal-processing peptidase [Massilia sp. IC2-477]